MFLLVIIVTRSFIIGVRYGMMSDVRYKLSHSKAKLDWISKDFLITGWFRISPESYKIEWEASMHRLQINQKDFLFTFIRELPKDLSERFSNSDYYNANNFDQKELNIKIATQKLIFKEKKNTSSMFDDELGLIHNSSKDVLRNEEEETSKNDSLQILQNKSVSIDFGEENQQWWVPKKLYKGDTILREITLLESAMYRFPWIIFIITGIRIVIQITIKIYTISVNKATGTQVIFEVLFLCIEIVIVFIIHTANLAFVYAGSGDFKRKLFQMKILQSLITPEKDEDFIFSNFFPTLNAWCTVNLRSWVQLRALCLDLGKKYTYRIFIYSAGFVVAYVLFFVFIVLSMFSFVNYELPLTVYVTGMFDTVIVFGLILQMFRLGAQINNHYNTHKGVFLRIKKTLWEAKNNYDGFMEVSSNFSFSSKLYAEMLKMTEQLQDDKIKYLDDCISLIDMIIQGLDYDREINPLKIVGITASDQILASFYTGIASFLFAFGQLAYSKFG